MWTFLFILLLLFGPSPTGASPQEFDEEFDEELKDIYDNVIFNKHHAQVSVFNGSGHPVEGMKRTQKHGPLIIQILEFAYIHPQVIYQLMVLTPFHSRLIHNRMTLSALL